MASNIQRSVSEEKNLESSRSNLKYYNNVKKLLKDYSVAEIYQNAKNKIEEDDICKN